MKILLDPSSILGVSTINIRGRKVFDNETSKDTENPTMLKSYDHFDQRSKLKSTANANDYSPAQVALAA